jgi:hypothetical protein
VTDARGTFEMDSLPAGNYILKAWHEGFGMKEQNIKVKSGELLEIGIVFAQ